MIVDNDRLVDARGIGVKRNGRWLVRGVDLAIRRGEIVTLIGPNGSGKSTTAKAVLGLVATNAGTIDRRPGLTVGYVPQKLAIDWTLPLTVDRLMTLTGRHDKAAVAAALGEVGVGHLGAAEVAHLSGGELQHVLIARAVIRKPDLLVLDEPTQGVDAAGEIALYELISDIRGRTGCGILLISHDLHLVMAATDTVICLNGHICCHGNPESVAGHPEYARLFGRRAAEALAVYRHRHNHVHALDGSIVDDAAHHDHGHDHVHDHGHDHGHRHDHAHGGERSHA